MLLHKTNIAQSVFGHFSIIVSVKASKSKVFWESAVCEWHGVNSNSWANGADKL